MLNRLFLLTLAALLFVACATQSDSPGAQRSASGASTGYSTVAGGFAESLDEADEWLVVERDDMVRNERGELAGGQLQVRRADEALVPLPLAHTRVEGDVTLQVASVEVLQQYNNPYDAKIEAVYAFPLPQDAAITDFLMEFNGRRIRGVIREREEAREIYDRARGAGHVASLMSQSRPNLFTQSVANIEPGARVDVRVTYFQSLRHDGGEFELRVPLVVGPRYAPPGSVDSTRALARGKPGAGEGDVSYLAPGEVSSARVSLDFAIDAGVPIEGVHSPTHPISVDRDGSTRAHVRLAHGEAYPNRDFVLRYELPDDVVRSAVALHRGRTSDYFALFLQPSNRVSSAPRAPLEVVLVVDSSSSMDGAPMEACRNASHRILDRLNDRDRFQIIDFDGEVEQFARDAVPATALNLQDGRRFLDEIEADGGTLMRRGMRAALGTNSYGDHRTIIVFLTDGYIGNEAEVLGMIDDGIGDGRIFSVGVSSAPNTYLLERMADLGRGAVTYIDPTRSRGDQAVDTLFARLERPLLTDLRIDWGGTQIEEVYPSRIPDLVPGRPLLIVGRLRGRAAGVVEVTARDGNRLVRQRVHVVDGREHAALETLWARAKIRENEDRPLRAGDPFAARAAIRETALSHGLLSDYTSFVAVDGSGKIRGDHGTQVRVPVPVPAGVRYDTTVTR